MDIIFSCGASLYTTLCICLSDICPPLCVSQNMHLTSQLQLDIRACLGITQTSKHLHINKLTSDSRYYQNYHMLVIPSLFRCVLTVTAFTITITDYLTSDSRYYQNYHMLVIPSMFRCVLTETAFTITITDYSTNPE